MSASLWWLLLVLPLASAGLCNLVLRRWPTVSAAVSVGSAALCFLVVLWGLWSGATAPEKWVWLKAGEFEIPLEFSLNSLSTLMLVVVTGVGLLVHVFSLGYMAEDEAKSRYYGGLSLFMFSMTGIVVSDNLAMIFVFWELVGVSSYLLIGHWYRRQAASAAANKAFLANRIGDVGFLLGIIGVYVTFGTLSLSELAGMAPRYLPLMEAAGAAHTTAVPGVLITLIALGLFCGAVGKSAQFPLHVWLPDAMEGPTPVSALIHAATMVAAGVYLLARVFFIISQSAEAMVVIAWVGAVTALLAALMATQQSDIKRILAYSTLSQLGLMVMAVGLSDPGAAMFHLTTHAFFKAMLFLGAGAVIHALHHEQDIWKMGGLAKKMPVVFGTFAVGTLALAGCPGLSGFFSKDAILSAAEVKGEWVLFWLTAVTSLLTAFYMTRLVVVAFLGEPRGEHAEHPHGVGWVMVLPLILLAVPSVVSGYGEVIPKWLAGEDYHYHKHAAIVYAAGIGAFVAGAVLSVLLYLGKSRESLSLSLLREKFYIDEIYDAVFVRSFDVLGMIASALDRWGVRGLGVKSVCFVAAAIGHAFRFLVSGSVQVYVFFMTLGLVILIFWSLK
jgi:NADH-quinone oxidoreductase subunit L